MSVAILGFGNIGSGVAKLLTKPDAARFGREQKLKYILDVRDFSSHELAGLFVGGIDAIDDDKDVDIVVETIGGISPAYDFTVRCLEAGKSVVTSNKELVAERGTELLALAKKNGVSYLFEASVGGAMPTVRPMLTTLAASRIDGFSAIVNGTTNFILTRMLADDAEFPEALALAQQLGYAETRNPADDVDGFDAQRKLAILSSIACGIEIPVSAISVRGISNVTKTDLKAARDAGGAIKLIARFERTGEAEVRVGVEPMFAAGANALCRVDDVFNGIVFDCSNAGRITITGRGAGKLPTAGAVLSDVMQAAAKHAYDRLLWVKPDGEFKIGETRSESFFSVSEDGAASIDEKPVPGAASVYKTLE